MELRVEPAQWGYGTWSACIIESLYARTESAIDLFISSKILLFTSLLCSDCSESAKGKVKKRHPREYRNIVDWRGEKIGMFMWIVDLKNDVNEHVERQTGVKKEKVRFEDVRDAFSAIYYKTTRQIEDDRKNAMDPDKIDAIPVTYLLGQNTEDNTESDQGKIVKKTLKNEEKQSTIHTMAYKPKIIKLGDSGNINTRIAKKPIVLPKKTLNAASSKVNNEPQSTPQTCSRCGAKKAIV